MVNVCPREGGERGVSFEIVSRGVVMLEGFRFHRSRCFFQARSVAVRLVRRIIER